MDFQYSFKHVKTGNHIISQSWTEFYKLQENKELSTYNHLGQLQFYCKYASNTRDWNERLNKFWRGARGYEKVGQLDCSGIFCSTIHTGLRLFMRHLHNVACMEGDSEVCNMMSKNDCSFHHYGDAHYPCLPEHVVD